MLILRAALLVITVYVACFFMGGLIQEKNESSIGIRVVNGLLISWTFFYGMTVVFIMNQFEFGYSVFWESDTLSLFYSVTVSVLIALGIVTEIIRFVKKKKSEIVEVQSEKKVLSRNEMIYLALFLGLVLFQLIKSVLYAYADGDDSYYVAVSELMASGENSLYTKDPYTGHPVSIALRYALAPFPIWVGYLGRIFGLNGAITAHICMPLVTIPVTYVIYDAIGNRLFENNKSKKYMFLCLIAVFVMFAHYSYYSAEVFMLTRSRQGKEVLACIIIPILFYRMLKQALEEEWKYSVKSYITIILIAISAALTSVFGNIIVLIMLFANFIYSFMRRAKIGYILLSASLALPSLAIVAYYYLG